MAGVPGPRLPLLPSRPILWPREDPKPKVPEDTMAYADTPAARIVPGPAWRRFGAALFEVLETIATAGPKSEALQRLTRLSDGQLAARGTTRDAEVRRILGIHAYR